MIWWSQVVSSAEKRYSHSGCNVDMLISFKYIVALSGKHMRLDIEVMASYCTVFGSYHKQIELKVELAITNTDIKSHTLESGYINNVELDSPVTN